MKPFANRSLLKCIYLVGLAPFFPGSAHAQPSTLNASLVGQWDEYDGLYSDVWADGDYVYLPNWSAGDGQAGRVHILDISDPTTPTLVSTFFVPSPNDAGSAQDVKVGDGLLFMSAGRGGADGVVIADVRDPTSPTLVGTVAVPGFTAIHNIFYADGYLYAVNSFTPEVAIVDLTSFDPDNPPAGPITGAKWILQVPDGQFVHDITVTGGRLYAAAWNSTQIFDISDIASAPPTWLGSAPGNAAHSLWPTEDGRFVVTGEERGGGGITVFEITPNGNLLDLTARDSFVASGFVSSVHNQIIIGNRLYNSWYEAGLQVFDIDSVTGELRFFASYDTSECWGVYPFLGDDRIILSDMDEGLLIVALGDTPNLPPSPALPPYDVRKNRFISFTPNVAPLATAIRVDLLDYACNDSGVTCSFDEDCTICDTGGAAGESCAISADCPDGECVASGETCVEQSPSVAVGWVGTPFTPDTDRTPADTLTALVLAEPTFRSWSPTVIHVGDCEIAPARTYGLRTTFDGVFFSEPLIVPTIEQPQGKFWADLVGSFDGESWSGPNRLVNVDDVVAMLQFLTLRAAPHITMLDLANEQPNFIINATDLLLILQGFGGSTYPPPPFSNQGDPTQCP